MASAADTLTLAVKPPGGPGGTRAIGTVTLTFDRAANVGGEVSLASSAPSVASVPATVTLRGVPSMTRGSYTATFDITTVPVSSVTLVTITARQGTLTTSASFTVNPPSVSALTVSPASVTGGIAVAGQITLTGPAPSGGFSVPLASSHAAVPAPASVSVPAGQTTGSFQLATTAVTANTTATVSAGGRAATLTLQPVAFQGFTVTPTIANGATPTTLRVQLNGPAPPGMLVGITGTGPPALLNLPPSIQVPAGQAAAEVQITTAAVSTETQATITATDGATTKTVAMTLKPPAVTSFTVSPAAIVSGASVNVTVELNGNAGVTGFEMPFSSTPAFSTVNLLRVQRGTKTMTTSLVTTGLRVATDTPVTLTVGQGAEARTATVTVKPATLDSLTLSQPSQAVWSTAGENVNGTLTLNGLAQPGGLVVPLASSNTNVVTVPATATVTGTLAQFVGKRYAVGVDTPVAITAGEGAGARTASIVIPAPAPEAVTFARTNVAPGPATQNFNAYLKLTGIAPPGGFVVPLTSSQPSLVIVPATLTVPAGSGHAPPLTFTIQVSSTSVTADTPVTITAGQGAGTVTGTLTIKPLVVSELLLAAPSIVGGTSSQATITLSVQAPPGTSTVALASSHAAVTVPATVNFSVNQRTRNVPIVTSTVQAETVVTITATLGSVSKTATLTLRAQ